MLEADVGRSAEARRVVGSVVETFGTIDILMNNAAIMGPPKPLYEVEEEEWDRAYAINLKAAFLLSKEAVPYMIRQRSGKIINVTSGLGEMVMPPFGIYSVTKAGLIHLSRIMAEELKVHNIQVNGLDPAVMDTKMQEDIRSFGPAVLGVLGVEEGVERGRDLLVTLLVDDPGEDAEAQGVELVVADDLLPEGRGQVLVGQVAEVRIRHDREQRAAVPVYAA